MIRLPTSLVVRMLASVAALAVLIFVIVGAAELWRERQELTRQARARSDAALALSVGPASLALWNYDTSALDMISRSLVHEGAITQVEIVDDDGRKVIELWNSDALKGANLPSRQLTLSVPQRPAPIGYLRVRESYAEVDAEIRRRAVDKLPVELLKILAIALGNLLLLHKLVTSRVSALVRQLRDLPVDDPQARINLPERHADEQDEIVLLGRAVNQFQSERALEMQRRRNAEEQLRDNLLERSVILGSLRDGLLALDRRLSIRYANMAAVHLLGSAGLPSIDGALAGRTSVWRGAQSIPVADWLAGLCNGTQTRAETSACTLPDGSQITLQAQVSPISGAHDVAWIVLLSDVSDALRSQQAEQARAAAEASNQAKSEFLSRMSHELRTPLNAIVGFAQTLGNDPVVRNDPKRQEWVRLIERAGWHLSSMIADVLDLSRIEAGNLRLDRAPVDLTALVNDAVAYVAADATREQITCHSEVDPSIRWVEADGVRIQQVLINLLSNAVKYNRPGGQVWIKVHSPEPGQVRIAVRDTGLGMDDAQQAALFQSFNRLGRELSGKPGTGIGLVVTRGLVAMMNGTLEVTSERGLGSCFTVHLPAEPVEPADRPALPAPLAPTGSHRLIYVEDDPVNALVMSALIARRPDLHLVVCNSLTDGLIAVRQMVPDLLLLDMQLPDGRGTDLLIQLKADPALARIPVVMVSADALDDSAREAMAAGAEAYVTKPLDFEQLLRQIDHALTVAAGRRGQSGPVGPSATPGSADASAS